MNTQGQPTRLNGASAVTGRSLWAKPFRGAAWRAYEREAVANYSLQHRGATLTEKFHLYRLPDGTIPSGTTSEALDWAIVSSKCFT